MILFDYASALGAWFAWSEEAAQTVAGRRFKCPSCEVSWTALSDSDGCWVCGDTGLAGGEGLLGAVIPERV